MFAGVSICTTHDCEGRFQRMMQHNVCKVKSAVKPALQLLKDNKLNKMNILTLNPRTLCHPRDIGGVVFAIRFFITPAVVIIISGFCDSFSVKTVVAVPTHSVLPTPTVLT